MRSLIIPLLVTLGLQCRQQPDDYFPLIEGARTYMAVTTRRVTDFDTSEQTEVRLMSEVLGEREIRTLGRVWVIQTPRDSGVSMLSYFRRDEGAVVQLVPVRGRQPMVMRYLVQPLKVGLQWYDNESRNELFHVVARERVEVPAGRFENCFKIAIVSQRADWAMHQWFAPGTGQVRWESRASWAKDGVRHEIVRTAELVLRQLPESGSGHSRAGSGS